MLLIKKYFPEITIKQIQHFEMLMPLYADWNSKINLISRKDFENFYEHHVLHSLAIAKFIRFADQSRVIDIGTGGGFPGIPLAILFPNVNFTLVDSISKKIKVVVDVVQQLKLHNVKTFNQRAEQLQVKADYVISRATAPLPELVNWTKHLFQSEDRSVLGKNEMLTNGWIVLKGGDLEDELKPFQKKVKLKPISDYFDEPFFETKKIVYLPSEA
jgi:16S rRNA (guanine527-N7)-methyltransferase